MAYLGHEIDPLINARVHALAAALKAAPLAGVREAAPGYACLLVSFDPVALDHDQVRAWVDGVLAGLPAAEPGAGRLIEVPVVYGGEHGPDLAEVAAHNGLSAEEVIQRHSAPQYRCYLVGFTPGFPYLGGLDPKLATPRLETPRLDLPPGVVGLAGMQTGLYPLGGPGGWRILGRTPLLAFDPRRAQPNLIHAGDRVRFTPVDRAEFPDPPPLDGGAWESGIKAAKVIQPGAYTTVQDQGRWGRAGAGVPVSGALDGYGLAVANALVGNPPGAAALELTLMGPTLEITAPVTVAVCGADLGFRVDGQTARRWRGLGLGPGQRISFSGPRDGARAVLAFGGGLGAPLLLGSRSAYPLGRLGAPLAKGQMLSLLGGPAPAGGALPEEYIPAAARTITLRVLPGPNAEHFAPDGIRTFYASECRITTQSDRRGVRLAGPAVALDPAMPDAILSEPNSPGVVQVPAGGQPMVLLNEQTVGGYAKIGAVISADLDRLARALPGDAVRFARVDAAAARSAAQAAARKMAAALDAITKVP